MKIKCDFVTNSSSSGYILSLKKIDIDNFINYMNNLNKTDMASNEGVNIYLCAYTIEELKAYTNDKPLDWISKVCLPEFINMTKESFDICNEVINSDNVAVECWVDYNVCDTFHSSEYGKCVIKDL